MTDEFFSPGYVVAPGVFVPSQINTSLKPQTTREFDVGIRWDPWHRVAGSLTYFQSKNRDEIYYNPLTGVELRTTTRQTGRAWSRASFLTS